jgi:glycosyltransferase involved in cell wall biosynthesis
MKDLVSICIPVYNGGKYLRQCLDSVLSQTFQNIEILIVDDCSTDDSPEIVQQYLKIHPSIRYFKNEKNLGLTGNWNKCIELANGEWIKFVFQDDFIENNCIEVFLSYAKNSNVPLLVSRRRFYTGGNLSLKMEKYYSGGLPSLSQINVESHNDIISPEKVSNTAVKYMAMNFIGEPTVTFFSTSVVKKHGYFNSALEQICDLEFVLRLGSIYGIVSIPHELTTFRIHTESVTSTNIATKFYKLAWLEPVKFAHLLLFSDQYINFRNSLTDYYRKKLEIYFHVRGYEAWKKAGKNKAWLADFNEAEISFPHLNDVKRPAFTTRIIYFMIYFRRILNKIAGR